MSLATDMSDGIGGLSFVAQAPPGIGRLIRIPFYMTTAAGTFLALTPGTDPNSVTSSSTSPIIAGGSTDAGVNASAILRTPQISWATLRIVGFEVAVNFPTNPLAETAASTIGELLVQDLKIGGGANLFVHEDFAAANIYASGNDSFSGLRDYPILKSPNQAEVTIAMFAPTASGATPAKDVANVDILGHILFSCNLVCEILQDDNYGSHIPGPYARKGAMVRRGGSFV